MVSAPTWGLRQQYQKWPRARFILQSAVVQGEREEGLPPDVPAARSGACRALVSQASRRCFYARVPRPKRWNADTSGQTGQSTLRTPPQDAVSWRSLAHHLAPHGGPRLGGDTPCCSAWRQTLLGRGELAARTSPKLAKLPRGATLFQPIVFSMFLLLLPSGMQRATEQQPKTA
jgi:hypothetical protein